MLKNISAVIVAAGSGTRLNSAIPKQFLKLDKHTVLYHSIQKYLALSEISEIIVAVAQQYRESPYLFDSLPQEANTKIKIILGGARRRDTVYNALQALQPETKIVCIHDSVRPFIEPALIRKTIEYCQEYDGAIVAVPAVDTLKEVRGQQIIGTLDRQIIWQAQTPQTFRKDFILKAYYQALHEKGDITMTDDASLAERYGGRIRIVEGNYLNLKITTSTDLEIARSLLKKGVHNDL
jgi:2-C-methyl-D-erythritol 4-phosphate cytidylyltransferase